MDRHELHDWLREDDPGRLAELWRRADDLRRKTVGDAIHLRGLVEISNHCRRSCTYCGIRQGSRTERYRMALDEILACVAEADQRGYGTVVLQAGEDPLLTQAFIAVLVREIKRAFNLAVTLSLGERSREDLLAWREAGADRYLLRFETSNTDLYRRVHPCRVAGEADRLTRLRWLRASGYEVGSGVLVGLSGQTWDDLVRDLETFRELDLDMIGVGPFIADPGTPIVAMTAELDAGDEQVPADVLTTCKVMALARLLCPGSNIPSTTALATIDRERGCELGLQRGANVVMPNLTPERYRSCYAIYPGKTALAEVDPVRREGLRDTITRIGRTVGRGRGDSPNRLARREQEVLR